MIMESIMRIGLATGANAAQTALPVASQAVTPGTAAGAGPAGGGKVTPVRNEYGRQDGSGQEEIREHLCAPSRQQIRMRFATMVMLAGIGFGVCTLAQAAGQAATGSSGWAEAQSLRELPAGIQALLGVGLGADGIADRGEDFNEGDVRADNMPTRRFALAVVHGDVAMVAVEQGGRRRAPAILHGAAFEPLGPEFLAVDVEAEQSHVAEQSVDPLAVRDRSFRSG